MSPTGLIPWVSKTEGNTYATLLHHPFPFQGKPTHAQEVARRISGAVAGKIYVKSRHTKYPLRESWIRGSPDSRTISVGRTIGL